MSTLKGRIRPSARAVLLAVLTTIAAALAATATSAAAPDRTAAAPMNSDLPKIQGKAEEGETLTATSGSWQGSQPLTYKAQWKRCDKLGAGCAPISGANDPAYKLKADDVAHTIRVTVTATNKDGSAKATSRPTAVVKAAIPNAPSSTSAPTVAGTAKEGSTLTADKGEWNGTQPIDFNYQWQRCDKSGTACSNISGANKQTYVLTSADAGNTVRVRVTATNSAAKTTAYSRATAIVAGAVSPPPPPPPPPPAGAVIPVSQVNSPERLLVSTIRFDPGVIRSRADIVTARFRIADTKSHFVSGALVLVTPLPYVWVSAPKETMSDSTGWATVQFQIRPSVPKKSAIVIFVRARKPGDNVLAGVSSRRLVQVLVKIP